MNESQRPHPPRIDDDLLVQCMHCGFCLPVCPTYALTGMERSSPRGRIRLMKAVQDGTLAADESTFVDEMSFCLGCRACETACPAGVEYGSLLESARGAIYEHSAGRAQTSRLGRWVLRHVFTQPRRLKALARLMRWSQRLRLPQLGLSTGLLPALFPKLAELVPLQPTIDARFSDQRLPKELPARGERRYRVGLLTGCVMNVAFGDVNTQTADLLAEAGCDVWVPRNQPCCGSLHGHLGDLETARALARRLIDTFVVKQNGLDAVIVNSAGCGSFMKTYDHLLAHDADYAERARVFASRVRDVHEWLAEIGWRPPPDQAAPEPLRVAYHDACHLLHAQRVHDQPRALIDALPGVERVELPESDWCCGSAGVYNVMHPDTAESLLERKMNNVRQTGAHVLLAANPGCLAQLRHGAKRYNVDVEVLHPLTLIHRHVTGKR